MKVYTGTIVWRRSKAERTLQIVSNIFTDHGLAVWAVIVFQLVVQKVPL